ncbi:MAG: DUF1501 domain-containing protein [Acidobacteriota bacterium]|jgi:hypothetical protein|nr:DUF1501 domain-containing protein [Bryobacteraceae bacterium CoA2 C42]MCA2965076.1 DUF1501 domain-containing protein [Acidobacteriaceae bacterium]
MKISRRELLRTSSTGFGYLAMESLLAGAAPHFAARAKNVIFCFMPGGVGQMDSFDPKPKLAELDGQAAVLDNYVAGPKRKWLKSPWAFRQHGQSGLPVSEIFPHIASVADELTVIRSMKSEFPLHARANVFLHTGRNFGGFPSLGSWVNYGLGSVNKNLPGYLLLNHGDNPPGGLENFSNGFLPATHQAMGVRADGVPVDNIVPAGAALQGAKMAAVRAQDREFLAATANADAVEAAISNFEMAYRMQALAPDVLNLDRETEATKKLYGLDATNPHKRAYGLQCLRARRLVEAGVRFVEITPPNLYGGNNGTWDQHDKLREGHSTNAMVTDQAVTALIKDLKSRGLLQETLVLWAGEFGRTPDTGNGDGRDHHPFGFTIWMAGGGAKAGLIYGATDELGNHAVENVMTVHDLHATVLHLLGLDHTKLSYRFGGRDVTLPDVHGRVVRALVG